MTCDAFVEVAARLEGRALGYRVSQGTRQVLSAGTVPLQVSFRFDLAKSVSTPCLVALIGARLEVAACRGTQFVDRAGYRASDLTGQCDAADRLRFSAAHCDAVR